MRSRVVSATDGTRRNSSLDTNQLKVVLCDKPGEIPPHPLRHCAVGERLLLVLREEALRRRVLVQKVDVTVRSVIASS